MPSTYSNLKIQLMATGENTGTWGNVTNDNLSEALEQALVETATVTFANADVTLTLTDTNAKQNARALRLNLTGTTGGSRDLIVPAIQKPYIVNNGTADTITVKVSGQTGVAVPASTSMLLYNNGTDVGLAFNRVVGNVTGTASNATVLQTARNIQISGNVTAANVSFDGSAAVNLSVTAINVAAVNAGTLGVVNGGTGAASLTADNVVIGNGTSAVKFVAAGTTGNVLTSNGSAWVSQAISAGGDYILRSYTSPATWTKPANLKAVKVTVIGAGGNGGSGDTTYGTRGGNGGGGGGAIKNLAAPAIPGPVTVTVGTAPSKTSSFGPFVSATGGTNGTPRAAGQPPAPVGPYAGGTGSGGDINVPGGYGTGTQSTGCSGSSAFGFGAGTAFYTAPADVPAASGILYGGGAQGRNSPGSNLGAQGIVIVEEFY